MLLTCSGLATSTAQGQSSRPVYAGAGLGPAALFAHEYGDCCDAHFRTEGELGWHPSGTDTGFFLAASATLMAGRHWLMFFPGLRLGGDIEVYGTTDFAVMLTPSGLAGGGVFDPEGLVDSLGFFVVQPAFTVKFVMLERLLQIWVRPAAFDLLFFPSWYDGDFELDAIYSFMAGAFFAF